MSENEPIEALAVNGSSVKRHRAKYTARVEYLAIKAAVDQMLDQGHTVKAVFEEMTRTGRITISYTSFCDYVRGGGRRPRKGERHSKTTKRPIAPQRPPARLQNNRSVAPDGPFIYDKDIDISELV